MLALGWEGSDRQWRHYRRAYGLFAALATPLVLSVHSVVSWDFAMALVPGWHSTLFAPFFVDGAIFSGFAMVLVLVLPMRHFFNLHAYIRDRHLDMMAKLILVTGLVLTYFYVCEVFTAWYSGDHFERASLFWRLTGTYAWALSTMYFCNCVAPLVLFWKRARTNLVTLYVVSILVLIGMWFERFNIIVPWPRPRLLPVHLGRLRADDHRLHDHRGQLRVVLHPVPRLHQGHAVAVDRRGEGDASRRR